MTQRKLNLGCGTDYREHHTNVDVSESVDPDVVHDLEKTPWPFEDNEFNTVVAQHVFEHLHNPVDALEEVARVLQPTGTFELVFPIGHVKYRDLTHVQYWNYETPEQIGGSVDHGHEVDVPLTLEGREVDWWIHPHHEQTYQQTQQRIAQIGYGAWMDQVPGLAGEVRAEFTGDV